MELVINGLSVNINDTVCNYFKSVSKMISVWTLGDFDVGQFHESYVKGKLFKNKRFWNDHFNYNLFSKLLLLNGDCSGVLRSS